MSTAALRHSLFALRRTSSAAVILSGAKDLLSRALPICTTFQLQPPC